jgi:alpha 1,4-N-acetylglucosaminyltransferase
MHIFDNFDAERLCALESVLRWSGDMTVTVHASNASGFAKDFYSSSFAPLASGRVTVVQTDFHKLFADTPFEHWYASGAYTNSTWVATNLGNAARLAVVYKQGGIYIDLDYIVQRSLSALPLNCVSEQAPRQLNNAFLKFDVQQHPFLWSCMADFVHRFNGHAWGCQGPKLVTRIWDAHCHKRQKLKQADWCDSTVILNASYLNPIHYRYALYVSKTPERKISAQFVNITAAREAVAVHYWNSRLTDASMQIRQKSFLASLLANGCPVAYRCVVKPSICSNVRNEQA